MPIVRGLLDRFNLPREKLFTGLVAVHALGVGELQVPRLSDLDRSRGTLLIRRSVATRPCLIGAGPPR